MKTKHKLLLLGAVFISGISFFFANPVKAVDTDPVIKATNYQMTVRLEPKKNQLDEQTVITVKNNSQQDFKQLLIRNIAYAVLKYDQRHYSKGNHHDKTQINSIIADNKNLNYKAGKDQSNLYVDLNQDLKPGQSTKVYVDTTTSVPYRRDRFGYQKVMGGKIFNLSFCFPYLSDYRNGKWNYHPYSDEGENRNSAISDYQVTFVAPHAYKVAASGTHTTNGDTTTIDAPNTRDLAIVASNRFKVSHQKAEGVEINNFYVLGKNQRNNHNYNILAKQCAADSLALYDKKFGVNYPYANLDITECPFPADLGGMEYSGLIMISDEGFLKKRRASTQDYDELLQDVSHEVAHQWFFGMVGSDEFKEPFLDEGMAEFTEEFLYSLSNTKSRNLLFKMNPQIHKHLSRKKVITYIDKILKVAVKSKKKSYINYPMDKIPRNTNETSVDYDTAKIFYAELMTAMGQKKFYQAMQDYCRTYYMKQATGKDFLQIIRKHDNSARVNRIINKFIDPKYLN